jgi:hypothetical protein
LREKKLKILENAIDLIEVIHVDEKFGLVFCPKKID